MTAWWNGNAVPWDLETDGKDPLDARIITSYAGEVRVVDGKPQAAPGQSWIVQPERDIPEEAAAVHGFTTDRARAEGMDRARAVEQIARVLAEETKRPSDLAWGMVPLVGHNVGAYDLTVLDRELRRLKLGRLADGWGGDPRVTVILHGEPVGAFYVIDTMVLDKAIDTYRPGPKGPNGEKLGGRNKLTTVAEFYGVPIRGDAHEASADAMASCRIAWAIARRCALALDLQNADPRGWPDDDPQAHAEIMNLYADRRRPIEVVRTLANVARLTLAELHAWQKRMAREQAESFRQYCIDNPAYVEEKGIDIGGISGAWPLRPVTDAGKTETVATVADGIL